MSDIGKAFDERFGLSDNAFNLARVEHPMRNKGKKYPGTRSFTHAQRMTPEQKQFCRFLSLDTYKDENGQMRKELIALLEKEEGCIKIKELRRPDFSLMKKYRWKDVEYSIEKIYPSDVDWRNLRGFEGVGYYWFHWYFSINECRFLVDKKSSLRKLQAQDVVNCLHKSAMKMNASAAEQLSKLHDTLDKQLQEAGEDVFIYELLQNANDYPYDDEDVETEFRLLKFKDGGGCLLFCHTGAEFTEKNVAALCSANDQDKTDNLSAIGYKGIGFKTVFRYNDRAEVRSGRFGFAFDKETQKEKDGIPWRTTPRLVSNMVQGGYRVQIRLFPRDPQKLLDGDGSYSAQLKSLFEDERPLLFIPRVKCVKLFLQDWKNPIIRDKNNEKWVLSGSLIQTVDAEIQKSIDEALKDLEHCRIPPKYRHLENTAVSFACRRNGRRLLPEENASLYCYLPAKDARWGFKFLMNSDMIPNGPRNDIEYSIDVNKYFARVAGEKFFEWIDSLIRAGQYEYDSIFALIPDFEECVKNRREKVIEFIHEFKEGFEGRLPDLRIPSDSGELVAAEKIVCDYDGIIKEFGGGFWKRLDMEGSIPHVSLQASDDFNRFIKQYKEKLGMKELRIENLVASCNDSESLQKWLSNPMANEKFIRFLVDKGRLEEFKDSKIFLDDKGVLGAAKEMYFHEDVEKYLKPFAGFFRYLPLITPCREFFKIEWFVSFGPKTFVERVLFNSQNAKKTVELLQSIDNARLLFELLVKNRLYNGKERYPSDFFQQFPLILEDGRIVNGFNSKAYSLFMPPLEKMTQLLSDMPWIIKDWIGFLDRRYFEGEKGSQINKFIVDRELAFEWNLKSILVSVADKFKVEIRQRMLDTYDDLKFYDFIFGCISEKCVNYDWIRQQLSRWPVLDMNGRLIERSSKVVFYYSENLRSWIDSGWLDDGVVILNEKYSRQKELFNLIGAKEYVEDDIGEIFRTCLVTHLNLDTCEKVISFHRFMATKRELINARQVEELKKVPIIASGKQNPAVELENVYLPTEMDVNNAINAGIISADIMILDKAHCHDEKDLEYWRWLGVKSLDEKEIFKRRLEMYLERQKRFMSDEPEDATFEEYHKAFISAIASGDVLQMLKEDGCADSIKKVRLFTKAGKLLLPSEIRLSDAYKPLCEFESYDNANNISYVSKLYRGLENIREFFVTLGVRCKFLKDDVPLLEDKDFCRYFWTEYLPKNESEWEDIKDCLKPNLPCVLDGAGDVRRPEELYHFEIKDYVLKLDNGCFKLPMAERVNTIMIGQLGLKTALSVEDALKYLLSNHDYKSRGRLLQWIYDGKAAATSDCVEEYRNNEKAQWRNGQKKFVNIKELCAIRRRNSGQVRLFANNPHVMDLTGLGIGGDEADSMRKKVEDALQWLGVEFVDDENLEIVPANDKIDEGVISDIAVRMLVFLAERYPEGWEQEFSMVYSLLKGLKIYKCSGLLVECKNNKWLRAEHGKFLSRGDSFYFVDDWQSKYVYGEMVAKLWEKVCKKQYSLDDLKLALDTNGGEYQLATRICSDCSQLLEDQLFMNKLQEVSSSVHRIVVDMMRETDAALNRQTEKIYDDRTYVNDEEQTSCEESEHEDEDHLKSDANDAVDESEDPTEAFYERYNVSAGEREQFENIFRNDGLSPEQMCDENRLATMRLYNCMVNNGLHPKLSEVDFIHDISVKGVGGVPEIETEDGIRVHVASAVRGIAYISPHYWRETVAGRCAICAIGGKWAEDYVCWRTEQDLRDAMNRQNDLAVIRIDGAGRTEQVSKFFEQENTIGTTHEIYALIRLRNNTKMDLAFTERALGTLDPVQNEDREEDY